MGVLPFQLGPGGDNAEENWERRERFYTAGGFRVFYPEGEQAYASVNMVKELKVADNKDRYLLKLTPEEFGQFVKRINQDENKIISGRDYLRKTNERIEQSLYACRKKLIFWRLLSTVFAVIIGLYIYMIFP